MADIGQDIGVSGVERNRPLGGRKKLVMLMPMKIGQRQNRDYPSLALRTVGGNYA